MNLQLEDIITIQNHNNKSLLLITKIFFKE